MNDIENKLGLRLATELELEAVRILAEYFGPSILYKIDIERGIEDE